MAETSAIEWTDSTFNPWIGCTKVSPGCDHCYAEARMDTRLHRVSWGAGQARVRTKTWGDPGNWNRHSLAFWRQHGRRQRVFCASLADWLDNEVPVEWLVDLLNLIRTTPFLDWLLLTKRIGNWKRRLEAALANAVYRELFDLAGWIAAWLDGVAPQDVWLGATIVDQPEADRDIPKLLDVPARVRFLSMEPLLGPVEFSNVTRRVDAVQQLGKRALAGIDWVIVGGESGHGARPMHPDWVRSLREQCAAAGVQFLFKQWGDWSPGYAEHGNDLGYDAIVQAKQHEWPEGHCSFRVGKKAAGRLLDGRTHDGFPEVP